jgi:hypothetical protein
MKLCKNCHYYVAADPFPDSPPNPMWAECAHPSSFEPDPRENVVTDEPLPGRRLYCHQVRESFADVWYHREMCGPDARYFEPSAP